MGIESNPGPQLNNKKNIKIIHNNVCSLLPKLDLIEHEFQEYDVICISESHLDYCVLFLYFFYYSIVDLD
jgi:predicted metal-dependent RNase